MTKTVDRGRCGIFRVSYCCNFSRHYSLKSFSHDFFNNPITQPLSFIWWITEIKASQYLNADVESHALPVAHLAVAQQWHPHQLQL